MQPFLKTPITGAALFHSHICDFLITPNGNDPNPKRHADIRLLLAAVGRWPAEVRS